MDLLVDYADPIETQNLNATVHGHLTRKDALQ
jgi:hypothetical protein